MNSIKIQAYTNILLKQSAQMVLFFIVFLTLVSSAANAQNLNWNPVESSGAPGLPNAAEPYTACEASWRSFNGNGPLGPTKFSKKKNGNGVLVSMICLSLLFIRFSHNHGANHRDAALI